MKVLLASRNAGKLVELQRMLAAADGLQVLGLADVPQFPEAPETGATFAENALAKARDAVAATGLPAVADDSGLAVQALNGMPGVLSARWAGRHGDDTANLELLLAQLGDVPDERRGGAFVWPKPGRSGATRWKRSASSGIRSRNMWLDVGKPCRSRRVGFERLPASR